MTDNPTQGGNTADGSEPTRLLLPVPGLALNQQWDVGHVRFHPAGTAASLIKASGSANLQDAPDWVRSRISSTAAELDNYTVADLAVSGDIDDAMPIVDSAVTVLRAVQHMECPMVVIRHQSFGLPGQVTSVLVSYFSLYDRALPGWRRTGALAGWTFGDDGHARWLSDLAYRFLDQALRQPEENRTGLQRRAMVAIQLLSNSWLSLQPDVRMLNAVMALEVLLGEDTGTKKHLIARRAAYFACGWPGPVYADGTRTACALMSLPLRPSGAPGVELTRLLSQMRAVHRPPLLAVLLHVLALYDARSTIAHEGKLGLSADQENSATWFIAARLLHRVLTWFAGHPDDDLTELDRQIAALSLAGTN